MKRWQVSCKQRSGADMELQEFGGIWRLLVWIAGNIGKQKIIVIVRIDEE